MQNIDKVILKQLKEMPSVVQGFAEVNSAIEKTVAEKKVLRQKRANKLRRKRAGLLSNDETVRLSQADDANDV